MLVSRANARKQNLRTCRAFVKPPLLPTPSFSLDEELRAFPRRQCVESLNGITIAATRGALQRGDLHGWR
jgi:hypothetical protein